MTIFRVAVQGFTGSLCDIGQQAKQYAFIGFIDIYKAPSNFITHAYPPEGRLGYIFTGLITHVPRLKE